MKSIVLLLFSLPPAQADFSFFVEPFPLGDSQSKRQKNSVTDGASIAGFFNRIKAMDQRMEGACLQNYIVGPQHQSEIAVGNILQRIETRPKSPLFFEVRLSYRGAIGKKSVLCPIGKRDLYFKLEQAYQRWKTGR